MLRRTLRANVVVVMTTLAVTLAVGCTADNESDASSAVGTSQPSPGDDSARRDYFASVVECAGFVPEVLPSGADPGPAQPPPEPFSPDHYTAWGEGRDQVTVGKGREAVEHRSEFPTEDLPEHLVVTKDGVQRYVVPVGDPGAPIVVEFVVGDCPYILWLAGAERDYEHDTFITDGYTTEEAVEYASRF